MNFSILHQVTTNLGLQRSTKKVPKRVRRPGGGGFTPTVWVAGDVPRLGGQFLIGIEIFGVHFLSRLRLSDSIFQK